MVEHFIFCLCLGWCLVERKGKVGWIPNSYLKKCIASNKEEDDVKQYLGLPEPGMYN